MVNGISLEEEQIELLNVLVEASRNTPREKRQKFYLVRVMGGDLLRHPYLPPEIKKIYFGDLEILARYGLINMTLTGAHSYGIDVLPDGYHHYEHMKVNIDSSYDNIEKEVIRFFDLLEMQSEYSDAFKKWQEAESLLWKSDSKLSLTTIGHLCREAIQEFVTVLVIKLSPENVDENKAHTKNRLNSVFKALKSDIGDAQYEYMEGISKYWDGMNGIIQRLEHGGVKEGKSIAWEDGRMVVFSTAFIVYEIHRIISKVM